MRLRNKIALITGGAAGIGLATARRFVDEGAKVFLVDLADDALQSVVDKIGDDNAAACVADVTREEEVKKYVDQTIVKYGRIDVFVNNAGIEGDVDPITDYATETFDQVMAVNVRGAWLGLKYVIPQMLKSGGGSIICTSSLAGLKGTPKLSAYVASKHAVVGMMKSVALEYAAKNIRINTINPAPIATRMIESIESGFAPGAEEKVKEKMTAGVPMHRYGQPEEVADLILYLASDESSYTTGTCFPIDGGMSAY
ncbi:MAG: SDR family NAD(P)-dependent oxidoreductase [Gammaproteobacteria bacterium]